MMPGQPDTWAPTHRFVTDRQPLHDVTCELCLAELALKRIGTP